MNPIREKAEYLCVKGFIALLRPLPVSWIYGAMRCCGALFFLTGFRRRKIMLLNLAAAFPEKKAKEHRERAKAVYRHLTESLTESLLLLCKRWGRDEIEAMVDEAELEKYRKITAGNEQGVIFISGHLGNWELLADYMPLQGTSSQIVARKGENRLIDERIVLPQRTRYGNKVIYKRNALINTVKELKRGGTVSFLIDQKSNRRQGVPVRFFGRETLAVSSCAVMQIRFKPLVIPIFMMRMAHRHYKLCVGDPVEWHDNGRPEEEQVQELTQNYQAVIEKMIRRYPEQWFWMHNRWQLDV